MDQSISDIVTVSTLLGYVKIKCSQSTSVDEITKIAIKKVSISNNLLMFGLELRESLSSIGDRLFLCPYLTWSEIVGLVNEQNILLSIRLFPTNFEDYMRKDRSTLHYLHDQVYSQSCFEIGCLDIKLSFDCEITEEVLDQLDKSGGFSTFFPSHVLHRQKAKYLRRDILNYASNLYYYSKEDCMLEHLNRLLMLTQFDSDSYACYLGAGLGIPIRLLLGPRSQVRVNIKNTDEVRLLCYFASIQQIIFSEISRKEGRRYQVKLVLSNDPDAEQPIIFTFDSKLTADTVLHTLEGYCKLSPDMQTNSAAAEHGPLLLNGCPFRPLMDLSACDQYGKCSQIHQYLLRSHITLERVLGEGQFGDVYKGTYRPPEAGFSTILVAVKACKVGLGSEEKQRWLEEADLHAKLTHPHIIKLYGVCRDEPVWLVLEFAGEGELRHYLMERQSRIALSTLVTFCHQLSSALAYLEALKIIHRDVAARNVLVANDTCVKLADFGMARQLIQGEDFYVAEQGGKVPIKWMAPESLKSRIFSSASDVWMFGVCMWEILSFGLKPFHNTSNAEAVAAIGRGERLARPETCLVSHYRLMLECWMDDPLLRPTFNTLQPKLRDILSEAKRLSAEASNNHVQRKLSSDRNELSKPPIFSEQSATGKPINDAFPTLSRPATSEADTAVHRAVYCVMQLILTVAKKPAFSSMKQLLSSVKKIGEQIRTLFVIIQQTVEEVDDVSLIDSAERQLTDSYHYLVEDVRKLRDLHAKGDVKDELYRRFLGQAFVVATDTRALFQSFQQCRQAHFLLTAHH
ncbi:protein tyrosine kinase [Echinococcus multilocularis]|uniref:Protein tyrosine kinase n=1 Tax=Echinococcus multilocularis TaxID=6211 RepID=A0A087VXK3_ECHMU|nr:protein tyrosine kinase [Echinococcus multilocularis]